MSDFVQTTLEDRILVVKLCRPEKKNALTASMYVSLVDAMRRATDSRSVRVLVLTGSEGVFTAGNDLQDFLEQPTDDDAAPTVQFLRALAETSVPMIAAVDGNAVGIGTTLLLHCEFVLATTRSRFVLPFINLGLVPEAASSALLPRLVGYQKAAELLMLGEPFDVEVAKSIGLVGTICEPPDLHERALGIARKLAAKPRTALRETKALLRAEDESVSARIQREIGVFSRLLESETAREIMAAFLEKREPDRSRID